MHQMIVVAITIALVVGCKGKPDGAASGSAAVASGSGSALAGSGSGSGSDAGSGSAGSGSAGSAVATSDEPEKPASDSAIIGIDLEWPAERVVKLLGAPTAKSELETRTTMNGDVVVSKWTWASQPGLTIKITTATDEEPDEEPSVYAMQIDPPSTIKTPAGIGIGATRAEVKKAYPGIENGPVNNLYTNDLNDALFFDFGKDKSAKAKVVSILRTPIEDAE
jgi:hypothetical protein